MEEQISTLQKTLDTVIAFLITYSFQVIGAIVVLILGGIAANWISNSLFKFMQKKNLDITFSKFMSGVVRIIVLAFAVLIALGKFGISTAPMIAALSAMAFGASFAIRGPLANYGAGISIILSRPFTVGQTITVKDVSGIVEEVKLANTRLVNEDGVTITIPNNQIVGEILYNSKLNKVVENKVGVTYDSDPEKAIAVISQAILSFAEVAKNPPPQIGIEEFGDFSINIGCRYWIPTAKYYQTLYAINLAIYKALKAANIEIPFPQMEVRLLNPAKV